MAFYHGSETRIVNTGGRPVPQTQLGVIGLVGTSPQHLVAEEKRSVNRPVLIFNKRQAIEFFGPDREGFTIPRALNAIFDQVDGTGGVLVIVVNVMPYDTGNGLSKVSNVNKVFPVNGTVQLHKGLTSLVVKDQTGTTTYVLNTDYTIDATTGVLTRISGGAIPAGATVQVSYFYPAQMCVPFLQLNNELRMDNDLQLLDFNC